MTLTEAETIARSIEVKKKHALELDSVEEITPARFLATFTCTEPPSLGVFQDRFQKLGMWVIRYSNAHGMARVVFMEAIRYD